MGDHTSRSNKTRKKHLEEATSSSESPSSSSSSGSRSEEERASRKRHKHSSRKRQEDRRRSSSNSRREKEKRKKDREGKSKRKKRERRDEERKHRRRSRREEKKNVAKYDESGSSTADDAEHEKLPGEPVAVIENILKQFPGVAHDLEQLLEMVDNGQAVDIKGISERSLVKHLKKLFCSLKLQENGNGVYLLPASVCPSLEVVGAVIRTHKGPQEQQPDHSLHSIHPVEENQQVGDDCDAMPSPEEDPAPRRRTIGPAMPSAELLAAAAKLTEAEAELRGVELEGDTEIFIGPPPPALVAEAESANEAERFEEITRIMQAEVDSPYDILGVNRNMAADNIKKRYWKLSLMVHPDKCSHPQAHQAFVILNKAFKDLQDPDKRKAMDDKIRAKEEQEELKAELQAMREAAQWRRLQGISMQGDDELLADMGVKVEPKRDEWMTTLPPERKPGVTMQTTKFSRSSREGRGDTSAWTDTPADRAQKAKMNYLEAYNEAAALASNEEEKKRTSTDADLVDRYNKAKRSKSLVEKHQEAANQSRSKRKSKQPQPQAVEKEEWVGQHPWKPWDRENDLTAGCQKVKLDSDNMTQGLASRFSSSTIQRNFL